MAKKKAIGAAGMYKTGSKIVNDAKRSIMAQNDSDDEGIGRVSRILEREDWLENESESEKASEVDFGKV